MAKRWVNSPDDEEPEHGAGADLHLELVGDGGRRAQLMRALREAIRSGRLAPGTRLPPYRGLAIDLGIARNTVAVAYAELMEEGWLTGRQGSGTRVAQRATPLEPDRAGRSHQHTRRRVVHDMLPSSPRHGLVIGYGTPTDHAFTAALDALCLALPDLPQGEPRA